MASLYSRSFLIPALLILTLSASGQGRVYFDKNWKRTDRQHGTYYRVFGNAAPYFPVRDYYLSGKQQFSGTSRTTGDSLVLEGIARWYNEDGQLAKEATYRQNRVSGIARTYYSDGLLRLQSTLRNDTLDGPLTEYFPWGSIHGKAEYRNGQRQGVYQTFSAKGQPRDVVHYKNGVPDGPYEQYALTGNVKYKGTAAGGQPKGTCYVYFEEGGLSYVFTMHNGMLDGAYFSFGNSGDTLGQGQFRAGMPLRFKSSVKGLNGSDFTLNMSLKDGIESGKVRRDGQVVLEYAYKEGHRTGIWKLYTYDGKRLLGSKDFTGSDCNDTYLQSAPRKFSPDVFLSHRFSLRYLLEGEPCPIVVNENTIDTTDIMPAGVAESYTTDHPLFHYGRSRIREEAGLVTVPYREPASGADFGQRNHCIADLAYQGLQICTRRFGELVVRVYTSERPEDLRKLQASVQPDAHTCYFFYQRMPEKIYPKDTKVTRLMLWRLSPAFKEAIKGKTLDAIELTRIMEHDFFSVDDFSGLAAHRALEEELYTQKK